MFDKLIQRMKARAVNDTGLEKLHDQRTASKRRYTRRSCDTCVSNINGHSYPVMDWSLGGLQVAGDTRLFSMNDEVDVTLKFKLSNQILSIPHRARVVRKTCERMGLEFKPLTQGMREDLLHVVNDYAEAQG